MEKVKFKTGDWGFFEFKLGMIKNMDGQKITAVSDGTICTSGMSLNDRFFPLDIRTKQLSDSVCYWSNKFHRDCKGLNYPDLNRKLIQMWVDMVEARGDEEKIKKSIDELEEFGREVCQKAHDLKYVEVGGVKIFR